MILAVLIGIVAIILFYSRLPVFLQRIIEFIVAPFVWIGTHFPTLEGTALFLSKPWVWLNELLHPITDQIPDSPFIPLAIAALLMLVFVLMNPSGQSHSAKTFDYFLKRTLSWSCAAFLLGMIFAAGDYGSDSSTLLCYTRFSATLYNISDWSGIQQVILVWTLLGTTLLSLYYLSYGIDRGVNHIFKSFRSSKQQFEIFSAADSQFVYVPVMFLADCLQLVG